MSAPVPHAVNALVAAALPFLEGARDVPSPGDRAKLQDAMDRVDRIWDVSLPVIELLDASYWALRDADPIPRAVHRAVTRPPVRVDRLARAKGISWRMIDGA